MSSNFGQIIQLTTELAALERLKNRCIMGKILWILCDPILLILDLDHLTLNEQKKTKKQMVSPLFLGRFCSDPSDTYAPVICIHGPHGIGDTGDIAGLSAGI